MTAASPSRLFALRHDRRGSVALEMAFVFPLVLLTLLGFYEAYSYIRTVAMVERAAASVANIMGRQTTALADCDDSLSAVNLGTYVDAAARIMSPQPLATSGGVFLSAVGAVNGKPTVLWQRRSKFRIAGTASILGTQGSAATLPAQLSAAVAADSDITVMVAEVNYRFTPFAMTANFWPAGAGAVTISRVAYFRARVFQQTRLSTPVCTPLPTPPA